jgi:hypothetical protein
LTRAPPATTIPAMMAGVGLLGEARRREVEDILPAMAAA